MRKRVQGWQSRLMSQAGKEVLVKEVGQAIPSYRMSTFILLRSVLDDLQNMLKSFWWGPSAKGRRKFTWVGWDKMCSRKEEGGMGF